MLEHLPALQVVLPLVAAPLIVLVRSRRFAWLATTVVSYLCLLISVQLFVRVAAGGPVSYAIGSWPPPWGIEYRVDALSAFVLVAVSLTASFVAPYAQRSIAAELSRDRRYLMYAMYCLSLAGLLGIAATGDAFNLFVFLEIASLASYVLVALGPRRQALVAAYQYMLMGTVGATFYVIGVGLLYLMTGTLNLVDMAERLGAVEDVRPVLAALMQQAANGDVVHNDDTSMTVLALQRPDAPRGDPDDVSPDRTGVFTSGIVSTRDDHRIALFVTGRRHAGENLARILADRTADLGPPIQMCDALARNAPKPLAVIIGHCLAHARRHVVDVVPSFPAECRRILEALGTVYHHDAEARAQGLPPDARLAYHQAHSGPVLEELHTWLRVQLDDHLVEPNSRLGQAIRYLLTHWMPLTLFLRQPGAPLDNSLCERALKKAILHRKNALFFKTVTGAHVGDLFMSLIHTCELEGVNPFAYLTALQRHAEAMAANPAAWLPWNYQEALATRVPASD